MSLITTDARATIIRTPAASFSTLRKFDRTPMHAQWAITHPPEPTEAMEFGTAVHLAVLEPDRFAEECVVAPKVDRRYKEGKAEWAAFLALADGKVVLSADDYAACEAMRDAVWAHPIAAELLAGAGHSEVGAVWTDAETGQDCKALIDRIGTHAGWTWLVDLKTCRDAAPIPFRRDVETQRYHAQAAMTMDGCEVLAPRNRRFCWIAVEKDAPHCVAVYEAPLLMLEAGKVRYRRWLRSYVECRANNIWPGYPAEVIPLELSRWETEAAFNVE